MKSWKIEILENALKHLWDGEGGKAYYIQGKQKYICAAISAAVRELKFDNDKELHFNIICDERDLKAIVTRKIEYCFTAESFVKSIGITLTIPQMQQWRKNFIEKMMGEI